MGAAAPFGLDLAVDPGWVIGLFLAQLRVAVFVLAAPQLGSAVPRMARVAFVIAVGTALTAPVAVPTTGTLLGHGLVNVLVGAFLGWSIGLLFHTFAVAGSLADVSAATSIATIIDPTRGEQGAVFARIFNLLGLTLFHVAGGLTLLVTVLAWSTRAVPLDGRVDPAPGLAELVIEQIGTMMVLGVELAAPIIAALFLVELVLGLASRFAPTANVFLLGMPVKVGLAMTMTLTSFAMFPAFVEAITTATRDTAVDVLNGLGATVVG